MKKFKVYFVNIYRKEPWQELAEFERSEEAEKFICKTINQKHEPNFYIRMWTEENQKWFDFGSHSNFYVCMETLVDLR